MQAARGTPLTESGAADPVDSRVQDPPPRRVVSLLLLAAAVLAADVATKVAVVASLSARPPVRLLGGALLLREARNSGAAFSIAQGATVVFTLVAAGVVVAILRTARRLRSLPWAVALGLLLGGAAGNLVDRILRAPGPFRGHVVDWIDFRVWPVFNLADSAIVVGGLLAVLLSARGRTIDGADPRADPES
ncbi:MAG: signal peptidase II [Actinomycetota bacterium]|nr:signal peptidase II [Actinomycetota bacterium]